ncbi:DNA ligase, partial [Candidatus Saccharibacteria bacterium]|nr:DNA ligase [Candidatus Saccharibacteria bacterium]
GLKNSLGVGTVLDGEIVVLEGGKPSFRRLQERDHIVLPERIEILSGVLPATYVVFDLLYLKGKSLLKKPLLNRRKLLEGLFPLAEGVILSESYEHGRKLFSKAVRKGFEGIMAKAWESPYLPGVRSAHWLKVKRAADLDAVVCGYTEGSGKRSATLGALVLGVYSDGKFQYIGRVGTGLDEDTLKRLAGTLKRLKTSRRTVEDEVRTDRKVHWTKPELVVKVGYQEKTRDGKLRAPVFKGVREDKPPEECTL